MDRDGTQKAQETFVSRGKAGRQVRKVRADGWNARRREIFLDHYAASANAAEACRAAGMYEGAAYQLRRRDPDFARQYDEAHAVALLRLEEMAVRYAATGGRTAPVEPGATPPGDIAAFDPEFALKVLSRPWPGREGRAPRRGAPLRRASKAELTGSILRLLDALDRRLAKQGK